MEASNQKGKTPLHAACGVYNFSCAQVSLVCSPVIVVHSLQYIVFSLFHYACFLGTWTMWSFLLKLKQTL